MTSQAATPPTCGGGVGAPQGSMSGNELTLANYINSYRYTFNSASQLFALPPNATNVGVAQWHARDMAANGYVGLVGSDGEDSLRRIVCSNGTPNISTGVIAIGASSDPKAVFDALQLDAGSVAIIADTNKKTSLSIGYSGGYWLIIMQ